jgi:hypothetical protein
VTAVSTCLSRHVQPPVKGAERIVWFAQTSADRARVQAWSCEDCADTSYQLAVLGAVWFIRRRSPGAVHETHREPDARTMRELWHRLLAGVAL